MTEPGGMLFWFTGGPVQVIVPAASIDEAKRKMASRGVGYTSCGRVGPGDGMPGGEWARFEDLPPGSA